MRSNLYLVEKCPACDALTKKSQLLFYAEMMNERCRVIQCYSCSLVYKDLFPTPHGMHEIYNGEYVHFKADTTNIDEADTKSSQQKLTRCNYLFNSPLLQKPKLIDIGCGSGKFVEIARKLGYIAEDIDPYLPQELDCSYLKRAVPEDVTESSYDIAVILNVAEHLDQPKRFFKAVKQLLKPGGVMLLTCPYGNSLARKFYKENWRHLALDEHLLFWTPSSLKSLLQDIGFSNKVSYRIGGSPFPYGKVSSTRSNSVEHSRCLHTFSGHNQKPNQSLQSKIWKIGRQIQRHELNANVVRSLINTTQTGDYLEYAIKLK